MRDDFQLYDALLSTLADSGYELKHEMCLRPAMTGQQWSNELMVIGRAVNGWGKPWRASEASDPGSRQEVLAAAFASIRGVDSCPMSWVSKQWGAPRGQYNTKSSAFWRVIRRVSTGLGMASPKDESWPSRLVWSNLYKLAPALGGNPSASLRSAQFRKCVALMSWEMQEFKPKKMLFLTGRDWMCPFEEHLGFTLHTKVGCKIVEAVGVSEDLTCQIVVARHPQGKAEDLWCSEVLEAYERLAT